MEKILDINLQPPPHTVIHPYVYTNVHSYELIHHTYLQKRKRKNPPLSIPWLKEMAILYAVGSVNPIGSGILSVV